MRGPIHFVDVTGTLQELGPGAKIKFNGRDGTRREIVLVDPDAINHMHADMHAEILDSVQHLSTEVGYKDKWAIARMQSLYDLATDIEMDLFNKIEEFKWLMVSCVTISAIALLLSIVSLFV